LGEALIPLRPTPRRQPTQTRRGRVLELREREAESSAAHFDHEVRADASEQSAALSQGPVGELADPPVSAAFEPPEDLDGLPFDVVAAGIPRHAGRSQQLHGGIAAIPEHQCLCLVHSAEDGISKTTLVRARVQRPSVARKTTS
jgi:hypothetical protein